MRTLIRSLVLLVSAASVATATVIVPAEFGEVVSGSQLIAHGRVTEVRAEWSDDRRRIDTFVTVDVLSWVKGGPARSLSFVVPGGDVGRYRHVVVGAPVFRRGEEAFLFLKAQGAALPYVFGLSQGVFRVSADLRGQRHVTTPALLAGDSGVQIVKRGDLSRRPVPIDSFRTQISAAMATGRRVAQ